MKEMPATFSVKGFLKVTRTWNLVIVALTQFMTAFFLLGKGWDELISFSFFLLIFTTGAVAAAGYLINDYYDIKIDLINKPDRVVIGKTLKRRSAMMFHLLLVLVALLGGLYLSPWIFLIHFMSSVLLWWYSNTLKRSPFWGNLTISLLTGATVLIVGVYFKEFNWPLYVYGFFAFFFTLLREIVKDIEDRVGDKEFGCRTLPIIWGVARTKKFLSILMVLFSLALILINYPFEPIVKLIFILVIIFMQIIFAWLLWKADTTQQFGRLSTLAKWAIVFGVLSMIFNSQLSW